jgi:transcriptional regulator with XRE-family HTH domain
MADRIPIMSKKRTSLGDQIREAVKAAPMSRNALCKATGIDKGSFSRFMHGRVGLTQEHIDAVMELLGLELRPIQKAAKRKAR